MNETLWTPQFVVSLVQTALLSGIAVALFCIRGRLPRHPCQGAPLAAVRADLVPTEPPRAAPFPERPEPSTADLFGLEPRSSDQAAETRATAPLRPDAKPPAGPEPRTADLFGAPPPSAEEPDETSPWLDWLNHLPAATPPVPAPEPLGAVAVRRSSRKELLVKDFNYMLEEGGGSADFEARWQPQRLDLVNLADRCQDTSADPYLALRGTEKPVNGFYFWLIYAVNDNLRGWLVPSFGLYQRRALLAAIGSSQRIALFRSIFETREGPAFRLEQPASCLLRSSQATVLRPGHLILPGRDGG